MRVVLIGVATYEEMKQRTLDVASGKPTVTVYPELKEPKIWITPEHYKKLCGDATD